MAIDVYRTGAVNAAPDTGKHNITVITGMPDGVPGMIPPYEVLVGGQRKSGRHAGTARGMIAMSADFDEPLPDFDEYMR